VLFVARPTLIAVRDSPTPLEGAAPIALLRPLLLQHQPFQLSPAAAEWWENKSVVTLLTIMKPNSLDIAARIACLIGISSAAVQVCNAQMFALPTGGLVTQYDASIVSESGGIVTWTDQAGATEADKISVTAAGPGSSPAIGSESIGAAGTKPVLLFGAGDRLSASSVSFDQLVSSTQGSMFLVLRKELDGAQGTTPFGWAGDDLTSSIKAQTLWKTPTPQMHFQFGKPGSGGGDLTSSTLLADNSWQILSLVRDGQERLHSYQWLSNHSIAAELLFLADGRWHARDRWLRQRL
jgi:hypothetical protein